MKDILLILIFTSVFSYSQSDEREIKKGVISFISSQNVYVKFDNTVGIAEGDTLFTVSGSNSIAAVIVRFISSTSCAGENIVNKNLKVDDELFAYVRIDKIEAKSEVTIDTKKTQISESIPEVKIQSYSSIKKINSGFSGRISTQSYSNFTNYSDRGNNQRWRHSIRLRAENIESTGLSFSAYSVFAYKADDWKKISSNIGRALKVYDLNLGYKFDESTRMWLGRYLNRRISNISSVDGLQIERDISSFTIGLVGGSRPDFSDFGYNFRLFEYGVYINKADTLGSGMMDNTVSVFEQTNDFRTDRRFIYLQHSNNIIEKTSFFVSSEIDLYKKILDKEENSLSVTSVFVSARYAPVRELSFSLSYDARKNVIYYETFKSFIDSVFENETRQGFRFRTNIRPLRNLSLGLNYGYRYRKSDLKQNTNYGGNISYTNIPLLDVSTNVSFSRLNSSYLEGNIYGVFIYKTIEQIYLDISIGFRLTEYLLLQNNGKFNEKSVVADVSSSLLNPVYISLGYEGIFEQVRTSGRILIDLSLRF
jgi:hypothetical protein